MSPRADDWDYEDFQEADSEEQEESDGLFEVGCCFPKLCVMPGMHFTSECQTRMDMERYFKEGSRE